MSRKYFRTSTTKLKKLSIESRKDAVVLKTILDELKHRKKPKLIGPH